MKQQERLWLRVIDGFLPKTRPTTSIMDLYRSRALIRAGLSSALLGPSIFLCESLTLGLWPQLAGVLILLLVPLSILLLYKQSGWLRASAWLYVNFYTALIAWAQLLALTVHALYWIWLPYLIVFSVLILGVREGALYTTLLAGLFWWVFDHNLLHGHSLGRFLSHDALLMSMALQTVLVQITFHGLMRIYDAIRSRTEVRAVMLRYTDDEAARLAAVGERMGRLAREMSEQLNLFQEQMEPFASLAKRTDTKIENLQEQVKALQEKAQKLREISYISNG